MIDTTPWLSHSSSYEDFIGNFQEWIKPETGVIKAVMHMS